MTTSFWFSMILARKPVNVVVSILLAESAQIFLGRLMAIFLTRGSMSPSRMDAETPLIASRDGASMVTSVWIQSEAT